MSGARADGGASSPPPKRARYEVKGLNMRKNFGEVLEGGLVRAVTELISNCLDEDEEGSAVHCNEGEREVVLRNYKVREGASGLCETSFELAKGSKEKDTKTVGKFGCGLNDALAICAHWHIKYFATSKHGTFELLTAENGKLEIRIGEPEVHAFPGPAPSPPHDRVGDAVVDCTSQVLTASSEEAWKGLVKAVKTAKMCFLRWRLNELDLLHKVPGKGEIFAWKEDKDKENETIFVHGLCYTLKHSSPAFVYNLWLDKKEIKGRDRLDVPDNWHGKAAALLQLTPKESKVWDRLLRLSPAAFGDTVTFKVWEFQREHVRSTVQLRAKTIAAASVQEQARRAELEGLRALEVAKRHRLNEELVKNQAALKESPLPQAADAMEAAMQAGPTSDDDAVAPSDNGAASDVEDSTFALQEYRKSAEDTVLKLTAQVDTAARTIQGIEREIAKIDNSASITPVLAATASDAKKAQEHGFVPVPYKPTDKTASSLHHTMPLVDEAVNRKLAKTAEYGDRFVKEVDWLNRLLATFDLAVTLEFSSQPHPELASWDPSARKITLHPRADTSGDVMLRAAIERLAVATSPTSGDVAGQLCTFVAGLLPFIPRSATRSAAASISLVAPATTRPFCPLIVIDEWDVTKGGISTFNMQLACDLAALGVHVFVQVTNRMTEAQKKHALDHKVHLVSTWTNGTIVVPDLIASAERVTTVIGHAHITGPAARQVRDLPQFCHAEFWLFNHVCPEWVDYLKDETLTGRYQKTVMKQSELLALAHAASRIWSVGRYMFDYWNSLYQDGARAHHHAYEPPLNDALIAGAYVRPRTDFKTATITLLTFGRVGAEKTIKGLDVVAKLFGKLQQDHSQNGFPAPRLIVRGITADTEKEVRAYLKSAGNVHRDGVTIREYGSQQDVIEDLRQATICIMASRSEPFGLVGLEAIASATPLLVSANSGLATYLRAHAPNECTEFLIVGEGDDDGDQWYHACKRLLAIDYISNAAKIRDAVKLKTAASAQSLIDHFEGS